MINKFYAWLASTDGVTGIEYGLIVCGIAGVTAGSALVLGDEITAMINAMGLVDLSPAAGISE